MATKCAEDNYKNLPSPPSSFKIIQLFIWSYFFSKNLSTSQFRINIIEMNEVSNTTHNSLGLISRMFPPIFLCTVGRYLRNLLRIFSQLCMFRQNSEKKIFKFMVFKSLENAFATDIFLVTSHKKQEEISCFFLNLDVDYNKVSLIRI